jgi:histidinol dehydrogenase
MTLRCHPERANSHPERANSHPERSEGSAVTTRNDVASRTSDIIQRVRSDGDVALLQLAFDLDGVRLESLEVPRSMRQRALSELDPDVRRAMERAMRNIERAHRAFAPVAVETETEPGILVGRRPDPLDCVGVYAPGGTAAYPSSVLMACVPARVAGVREVILCSPPGKNGLPAPSVLAAAELCGVDRVFALGGAGAIAAMALGTTSVPRVDRIVGPGNSYVAEAKRQLAHEVSIDSPAGPSELLVIADESAKPIDIAAEMVAQAEHDVNARVLALVPSTDFATDLKRAVANALTRTPRADTARAALAGECVRVVCSMDEALKIGAEFAPEHLLLAVADADALLPCVRNAGCVFLGTTSSVAFGDYMTGSNHVLPTGGAARRYSGLSTSDFVRWTSYQRVSPSAASRLSTDVAVFADAEGLPAHASAARARMAPPTIEPCDLSDNRNLFGVAPSALRALKSLDPSTVLPYPSGDAELRQAFARYLGCAPENVVTGNGSDQLIELAFRALAGAGHSVAYCEPTFSMIPRFVHWTGSAGRPVPNASNGAADVRALIDAGADLTYVCSPNNPTGVSTSRADLEALIAGARGIVVIDEAYAEYAGASVVDLAPKADNLVVLRTLSKAFGLAGLRVGAAITSPFLAQRIASVRAPFSVNAVAQRIGADVLNNDVAWMNNIVRETRVAREELISGICALGLEPIPSDANFVFIPLPAPSSHESRLTTHGIRVRALNGGIRVTVGPTHMVESFLMALRQVIEAERACA